MSQDEKGTEDEAAVLWQAEVGEIYDLALKPGHALVMGGSLPVSEEMASRIENETGKSVAGYVHVVDNYTIRHIVKRHGHPGELKQGQTPLVRQDFLNLLHVITDPDTLELTKDTKQGLTAFLSTKEIDGHNLFFVQSIETGRMRLRPVTFYKRPVKNP
jgi:hypothetical protein